MHTVRAAMDRERLPALLAAGAKTIEAHLGRAYRKLGVHNRAQLATTLTRQATA